MAETEPAIYVSAADHSFYKAYQRGSLNADQGVCVMEKSVKPDEKVKELFCYEVNNVDMYTKGIGVTESGKYYIGLY